MRSPFLGVAGCWAFGIVLAHALHAGPARAGWMLAASGVALLGALAALVRSHPATGVTFAALGFVLAGAMAATLFSHRFSPNHIRNLAEWGYDLKGPVAAEAAVESVPIRTPWGFQFDAEVREVGNEGEMRRASGRIPLRLRVPARATSWAAADALRLEAGDLIRAPVQFYRPTAYRNPGGFDYRSWLESIEDITWEGSIANPLDVRKLGGRGMSPAAAAVQDVRRRLLAGIDQLYPPWSAEGRDGAVLKAVLLGDRSSLDSPTIESFRKSGLYHLLVISGLHVGLLAALALGLLRWLGVREAWRGVPLLALLICYALLVEQRAPTLRATLMIGLYLLARYLYRDQVGLNAVGFAALVLLLVRPAWLFEAGFQLSFSAALLIFAIVVPVLERTTLPYRRALDTIEDEQRDPGLQPRQAQLRLDLRALIEFLKRRSPVLDRLPALARGAVIFPVKAALWAADLTVFSAILQLGLLMPMAESFHRIALAGIGLNTLAIPVMTVLLGLAVPTVVLAATVPALAVVPGKMLAGVMSILFALTSAPHLPWWLSYRVPSPPAWVAWGFALSVVIAAWAIGRRGRVLATAVLMFALFAALVAWYPFAPQIPGGILEATALDCGRGQATFLVLPDRTTALVGACGAEMEWRSGAAFHGRWDPGEDIVSPYLWSRGLERIDILVATDSHPGRLDGMAAVVRNFHPREFWEGGAAAGREFADLVRLIQRDHGHLRDLVPGQSIRRDNTSLEILSPPVAAASHRDGQSEESVALWVRDRHGSLLLPGGMSEKDQEALARSGDTIPSEVLESEGRGAALYLDPGFLERVSPPIVLVSGGRWSEGRSSMRTFFAGKARILSTEHEGAITIEMKESTLVVHFYKAFAAGAETVSASKALLGYSAQ